MDPEMLAKRKIPGVDEDAFLYESEGVLYATKSLRSIGNIIASDPFIQGLLSEDPPKPEFRQGLLFDDEEDYR